MVGRALHIFKVQELIHGSSQARYTIEALQQHKL
jgi:hypothetical protein